MATQIRADVDGIQYKQFFQKAFYGVSYTDYLFSLPMGAGKTYLMAAFICLGLYFAGNEPSNPAFAHNFIILAPSGLKSSVVPSRKTILRFAPSWVVPEPAASSLKCQISFRGRNIILFLHKMISSFYESRFTADRLGGGKKRIDFVF